MRESSFVALDTSNCYGYPDAPFNPPEVFPEFSSSNLINEIDTNNKVYGKVRNVLKSLELDKERLDTNEWNPLSELVKINDNVVIKPNLVLDSHPFGEKGTLCTITHASVIRPVIDYIILATKGKCNITICDAPLQSADWENLIEKSGLYSLSNYYLQKGINLNLLDLRTDVSVAKEEIILKTNSKERDPLGYLLVDLGSKSELMSIIKNYQKFKVADYGKDLMLDHHNPFKNEYHIARTILNSDVFINVPKIKTHKRAGITCSLKNLIGINGDKKIIPHHRVGSQERGGDEYPEFNPFMWFKWNLWSLLKTHKVFLPLAIIVKNTYLNICGNSSLSEYHLTSNDVMEGSWYGNDTIWRSILDINKILFYADKNGIMTSKVQRTYFCIVDGVISAEKEGPLHGTPRKTGVIMGGLNPVAVDNVCAEIMGFDYMKIPQLRESFESRFWELVDFVPEEVTTNLECLPNFRFSASHGWKGYVEKDN